MVELSPERVLKRFGFTGTLAAVLMIIFGILVIIFPDLIAWIVGLYLIITGIVHLIGSAGVRGL